MAGYKDRPPFLSNYIRICRLINQLNELYPLLITNFPYELSFPPLPSLFIRTNILFNGTRPARLSRPFDIAVSLHKTRGLHKTGGQAFLEQHRSERQGLGCLGWKGSQLKKKKKKTSSGLSATLQLHAERIRISLSLSLFYFHRDNNLMIHRTL